MKALETFYKRHKFRSRLEARWAVFFDCIGQKWEYEKEGYELNGFCYLPDFWLPKLKSWIEIKGEKPSEFEKVKAKRLTKFTGHPVYLFFGSIEENFSDKTNSAFSYSGSVLSGLDHYVWCQCPQCGEFGITIGGSPKQLLCCYENEEGDDNYYCYENENFNGDDLQFAIDKACSFRFGQDGESYNGH